MQEEEFNKRLAAQAGTDRGRGHQRHAAADQAGTCHGQQAEGLSRRQASARRRRSLKRWRLPSALKRLARTNFFGKESGSYVSRKFRWLNWFSITARAAASRAWPAIFLRPGTGDSRLTARPFDQHFVTDAQRIMAKSSLVLTETASHLQHRGHVQRRRRERPGWRGPHGYCARAAGVQSRAARQDEGRRLPDAAMPAGRNARSTARRAPASASSSASVSSQLPVVGSQ